MELKHSHPEPKKILHYLINLLLQNKTDIILLKYLSFKLWNKIYYIYPSFNRCQTWINFEIPLYKSTIKEKNKFLVENPFEIVMKSSDIIFQSPEHTKLKTEMKRTLI